MELKLEITKLPHQKIHHYEELIEEIMLQIVDYPDDVQVDEVEPEGKDVGLAFVIKVNKLDRGKVIGKQGTTIGALHKLFAVISRQFVKVNIVDHDTNQIVR